MHHVDDQDPDPPVDRPDDVRASAAVASSREEHSSPDPGLLSISLFSRKADVAHIQAAPAAQQPLGASVERMLRPELLALDPTQRALEDYP